jgi:hypothetical protein
MLGHVIKYYPDGKWHVSYEGKRKATMTRDQFLTEWMGECWHEYVSYNWRDSAKGKVNHTFACNKCGHQDIERKNNNFSTWPGFGKLWEAAWEDKDFDKFLDWYENELGKLGWLLVNPNTFADSWAKFQGWKEDNDAKSTR